MRRFGLLVVICSLISFIAMPASAKGLGAIKKGTRTVIGMVKTADANSVTISVVKKKGTGTHDRSIKITKETTITVDGKAATLAALVPGVSVKITLSHGHTDQIDVTTKPTATSDDAATTPTPDSGSKPATPKP